MCALATDMQVADDTPLDERWWPLIALCCPANVLASYLFFDVNAHTWLMVFAWAVQVALNTSLFFVAGALVGMILERPLRSTR